MLDSNKIDTMQKVELIIDTAVLQKNNSQELDSLNQTSNKLSLYDEYIEPIIAVVSAALITILLFSVRSKK